MTTAVQWRANFAKQVGRAYSHDPKIDAVAIGGSVARGWADRHSDIELFVFWKEPPSDEERVNIVINSGGTVDINWRHPPVYEKVELITDRLEGKIGQIWPYEDDEWSEHYYVAGVNIGVSGFLSSTMDQYFDDVNGSFDPAENKQILISAIQHGVPISGQSLIDNWQKRANNYPDELAAAIITKHLSADNQWPFVDMLIERDERLMLSGLVNDMIHKICRILLAANHIYLPDPRLKWLDHLVEEMAHKPANLSLRIKKMLMIEPDTLVGEMEGLFGETLSIVEDLNPEVETALARRWIHHRRALWEHPPGESP